MSGRLLVVSNFYPPSNIGGAEVVAHRQAQLMLQRGWTVKVFAGRLPGSDAAAGATAVTFLDGIEVLSVVHRSLEPDENFRWPHANRLLRAFISDFQPDWVHFHNVSGLGVDLIRVASEAGARCAVTLHDYWGHCFRGTRVRRSGELCADATECHLCDRRDRSPASVAKRLRQDYVLSRLSLAEVLISPSRTVAEAYAQTPNHLRDIFVQSNGIDTSRVPTRVRKAREKVHFLCAAYLGEHKGIPILLDAIRQLAARTDLEGRWTFTLAGHGHLEEAVRTLEQEVAADVHYVGRKSRDELLAILDEIDVVVLPSTWPENEPVVLLEGIAAGTGLIATDLGGNRELVENTRSGLLVEAGSSSALCDAFAGVITSPKLIEQMSACNIQRRGAYDEQITATALERIYSRKREELSVDLPSVICAGKHDLNAELVLSTLHKAVPESPVRLIWNEWAEPTDWSKAAAFWCWDAHATLSSLKDALAWRLPIIAWESELAREVAASGATIIMCADVIDVWQAFELVASRLNGKAMASSESSLRRFDLRLRPVESFWFGSAR